MNPPGPGPSPTDRDRSARILVCVGGERNRRLLSEWLDGPYRVVTGADPAAFDGGFDLCLLDQRTFADNYDRLRERERAEAPVFLPYLVLAEGDAFDRPGPWNRADEVVAKPVRKAVLATRIERLLEQRRLSAELDAERCRTASRFETLFEALPDPAFVVDAAGSVRTANGAFTGRTGVSSGDTAGLDAFLPRDTVAELLDLVTGGDPGARLDQTTSYTTASGRTRVAELHTEVARQTAAGVEAVCVFRDITERTEQAEELQRQNERLDEFASLLAHEIRNPLSIATIHLDKARDGHDESFETAAHALDRIERMVDELLTLARQGDVVGDYDVVNLERVARRAWASVDTEGATMCVENLDRWVAADGDRLQEVFENLFRNSVEHGSTSNRPKPGDSVEHGSTSSRTKSGDIAERRSASSQAEPDDSVEQDGESVSVRVGPVHDGDERGFFVADDGPGIPPEERESVFERGYTSAGTGTGLGLPVVEQVVGAHGWSVRAVESESGGARFEVLGVE